MLASLSPSSPVLAEGLACRSVRLARGAGLPDGLLGAARRPLDLLERFGEGQQLLVGAVQVDVLPQRLPHLVGGRVVELDPVVFGIEEVDAAGDPVRYRAVDLHTLLLGPVMERPHIAPAL